MALELRELAGMTHELVAALKEMGINDSDELLAATAQRKDRDSLATNLGVEAHAVLQMANRADLARIRGIGKSYSDLLELTGVDTVMELKQRNADNLYAKIVVIAKEKGFKRYPREDEVHAWVYQAQQLDRALFY